ncbi:hypothetical protein ACFCV3_34335 [Kribbella sp. NPDC056345]|uniref:hypothetical protein n=1 Tax=Kribbella sp. NPDC056345 TaxID=3345789 RepID=UPI0035D6E19D
MSTTFSRRLRGSTIHRLAAVLIAVLLAVTLLPAASANAAPTPPPKADVETAKPTAADQQTVKQEATKPQPAQAIQACGGAIAWHTVVGCSENQVGGKQTFTLPSLGAADQLALRITTDPRHSRINGLLRGPDGSLCSVDAFDEPNLCAAGVPGDYVLEIRNDDFAPFSYTLSAVPVLASNCAQLSAADLSPAAPGRSGELPLEMAADCYQFSGTAGDVVQIGTGLRIASMYDAEAREVCNARHNAERCELSGTGPYRVLVLAPRSSGTTYTLRLARLNSPVGCDALPVAPFGDPGPAAAAGHLEGEATACRTLELTAGRHWLRWNTPGFTRPSARLYTSSGDEVCNGYEGESCSVPAAGRYTALFDNSTEFDGADFTFSAVALSGDRGCAPETGTSWDLPELVKTSASVVQVDCQPIRAASGERMHFRASAVGQYSFRILDANNAPACELKGEAQECTMSGTAPFRVLVDASRSYDLEIGRLSNATGCTPLALTKFGQGGAVAPAGSRCRELEVSTPTTYVVTSDIKWSEHGPQLKGPYGDDGMPACDSLERCTLQPGRYVVLAPAAVHISAFSVLATEGCTPQPADEFAAKRGTLGDDSQFDCMTLNAPAGALLMPVQPNGNVNASGFVLDAAGVGMCSWDSSDTCELKGTPPFRVLIRSDRDDPPHPYALIFPRIDQPTRCAPLPQGDFTTAGGASVTLRPERFATCLAIPAGAHSGREAVQYSRTAGSGTARFDVLDDTGHRSCGSYTAASDHEFCLLGNRAYQALVVGSDATSTVQVVRRDITETAKGCTAITSTAVGSAAANGTIDNTLLRCYSLKGAATDRFVLNVRDKAASVGAIAFGSASTGCTSAAEGMCVATGSSSYQVITWNDDTVGPRGVYRLEAFKVATAAGPVAECTKIAESGYGFGPLTGELSASRTATCATFPAAERNDFTVTLANQAGAPHPAFRGYGGKGRQNCSSFGPSSPETVCSFYSSEDEGTWIETALMSLPETEPVSAMKYRLSAVCQQPLCGGATFGVTGVSPAGAPAGSVATVTVKGKSLHVKDVVRFEASGKPNVVGVVKSVSADRTAATVSVNLAGAATGIRNLVVDSFAGTSGTVANAFTVGPAALLSVQAPTVAAPVRVGSVAKANVGTWSPAATSYTYQWRDNGAAIRGAGAATYTPGAALLGHKLSVTVTAARAGYASKAVTTAAVAVATGLAPKATKGPVVTGTYKVGKTVTSSAGTWAPACTAVRFQWYSAGKAVVGGTKASLVLSKAMGAKALYVAVTCARTGHASGVASTKPVTVAV